MNDNVFMKIMIKVVEFIFIAAIIAGVYLAFTKQFSPSGEREFETQSLPFLTFLHKIYTSYSGEKQHTIGGKK